MTDPIVSDPAKGYTPAQKHHLEMLRKRRAKLELQDEAKRHKEAKKK